jgi:hypothetical protein
MPLWRSAKPVGYSTVRRGGRVGYVASIGLPITNHLSPITSLSDIVPRPRDDVGSRPRQRPALPGFLPCILTRRFAFGVSHFVLPPSPSLRRGRPSSSSKAVVSSKDWLNPGDKDYGDLDNDGNSLTASSIVEGPFLPMRTKPDAARSLSGH